MHPCVPCSNLHNSQDMKTTRMSINRGMDYEDMVHIYDGKLLSHQKKKNKIMSFAATWMQLDILILRKVSQKVKDKYHMISLLCGI